MTPGFDLHLTIITLSGAVFNAATEAGQLARMGFFPFRRYLFLTAELQLVLLLLEPQALVLKGSRVKRSLYGKIAVQYKQNFNCFSLFLVV